MEVCSLSSRSNNFDNLRYLMTFVIYGSCTETRNSILALCIHIKRYFIFIFIFVLSDDKYFFSLFCFSFISLSYMSYQQLKSYLTCTSLSLFLSFISSSSSSSSSTCLQLLPPPLFLLPLLFFFIFFYLSSSSSSSSSFSSLLFFTCYFSSTSLPSFSCQSHHTLQSFFIMMRTCLLFPSSSIFPLFLFLPPQRGI